MGGGSDWSNHSNNSPRENDRFEQLGSSVHRLFEYLDELMAKGKQPSQKIVGLLCKLADGEFISHEKLEQIHQERLLLSNLQKEFERERMEKEALQKELAILKEHAEQETVDRQNFNKSFENIKDKYNRSANKTKKSIGGIVEFD